MSHWHPAFDFALFPAVLIANALVTTAVCACTNLTAPPGEDPNSLSHAPDRATVSVSSAPVPSASEASNGDSIEFQRITIHFSGMRDGSPSGLRTEAEAREFAATIVREARLDGSDFEQLIEKYTDVFYENGDRWGEVLKGGNVVDRAIESVVTATGVGRVSDVVETDGGLHIIKRVR